ncbi:hypothetical protein Tco_0434552 [Tanacetum coccineum]
MKNPRTHVVVFGNRNKKGWRLVEAVGGVEEGQREGYWGSVDRDDGDPFMDSGREKLAGKFFRCGRRWWPGGLVGSGAGKKREARGGHVMYTRPPMLDRTDFESWQQRIRLYCLGKDNGENIMKSITEGPFQMGTMRDTLTEGGEDNLNPYVYNFQSQGHIALECPQPSDLMIHTTFKDKKLLMHAHYAFDSDVDEAPNIQTMFMVNLSSEDPIYDEAGSSYDSNTLFEVQDHDTFVDHMDEYHEVHEMQNDVQHNYVVDSNAEYTSDSNIIPYNQYLEDNEENGVQSNVSSVQNDALMSIINEMHEEGVQQGVQSRLANKPDKVVNDSLTSELARYKELVGVYEQRAKFELTDRERKIDEQMRIIISDRNRKETSLKSELHSAQLQLRSTLNHHKIVREEAIILKKDFKQKEDKFLEEFLDIKRIKEKVEDRLYKQDQSVQTVHMLCKPKSFYDEKNKRTLVIWLRITRTENDGEKCKSPQLTLSADLLRKALNVTPADSAHPFESPPAEKVGSNSEQSHVAFVTNPEQCMLVSSLILITLGYLKSLRIILVILPEHRVIRRFFTMKVGNPARAPTQSSSSYERSHNVSKLPQTLLSFSSHLNEQRRQIDYLDDVEFKFG